MDQEYYQITNERYKHVLREGWFERDVLMKAIDYAGKSCIDNIKDFGVFTLFESDPEFQGIIVCNSHHYIALRYRSGRWILHEPKLPMPLIVETPEKNLSLICSNFTKNTSSNATIAVFKKRNINQNGGDCYPSEKPGWKTLDTSRTWM